VRSQTRPGVSEELTERVRSILESKGLTLYQASKQSATLFGQSSPYYLPHNFYYDLRSETFSPSLFQLFALSTISKYRFMDWLRVFGFDLEAIATRQIQFSSRRTVLLDSSLDDPNALIPGFRNLHTGSSPAGMFPLSKVLDQRGARRLGSFGKASEKEFLYAKIGEQDDLAFPELLPGSVVRVSPGATEDLLREVRGERSRRIFLVEHAKGLFCCRLQAIGTSYISPIASDLPYAQIEFRVPQEARLVGVVDLEIRNLLTPQEPRIARYLSQHWNPPVLPPSPRHFGDLLRNARLRLGLSLRSASAVSRELAKSMDDERYFIAPGSLSDYEARAKAPRHFHKIISFCTIYSLRLKVMLKLLGVSLEEAGGDPMPDHFLGREVPEDRAALQLTEELAGTGFLRELVTTIEEIPFFLRWSLKSISGLTRPSLRDVFWIGGVSDPSHPYLSGGLLAAVNRQIKKPNHCEAKSLWLQPLYVVLKRDGTYLCGCCSRENHYLVVHSYPGGVHKRDQFCNGDAEIIGKITAVVRRV